MKTYAIEREFGSGGRAIGKGIADELKIPFYDGDLLVKEANDYGLSLDLLKEYDEMKSGSMLYNIAMATSLRNQQNMEKIHQLYYGMQQTILKINREGPAVFIGRCSTDILKDKEDVCRVFIKCSNMDERVESVIDREKVSEKHARKMILIKDHQREHYYNFWTDRKWKDFSNYDVVLDTSKLGTTECVEQLLSV